MVERSNSTVEEAVGNVSSIKQICVNGCARAFGRAHVPVNVDFLNLVELKNYGLDGDVEPRKAPTAVGIDDIIGVIYMSGIKLTVNQEKQSTKASEEDEY